MTPEERRRYLEHARELFNGGEFWLAHEALETVWRSIIKQDEARVWQGLIQAAAALLHRTRGNRHGTVVVGAAALAKLPARSDQTLNSKRFGFARSWRAPWRGRAIPRGWNSDTHD